MKYGELHHLSHPEHKLYFVYSDVPFKCDGCHQVGIGSRFSTVRYAIFISTLTVQMPPPTPQLSATLSTQNVIFNSYLTRPGTVLATATLAAVILAALSTTVASAGVTSTPAVLHSHEFSTPTAAFASTYATKHQRLATIVGGRGKVGVIGASDCKKLNLHVACAIKLWLDNLNEHYDGRGDSNGDLSNGMAMILRNKFPIIKAAENNRHRTWMGKLKKCSKLAVLAVKFIIAAMLGDPTTTTLIAGVVSSLLSE